MSEGATGKLPGSLYSGTILLIRPYTNGAVGATKAIKTRTRIRSGALRQMATEDLNGPKVQDQRKTLKAIHLSLPLDLPQSIHRQRSTV